MDNIFNINFPINDSDKGYFVDLTTNSRDGLIADIKHVLMTTKGTRYFRPSFGANLRKFLFDPNDETTHEQIKGEINNILSIYFPNISINGINIILGDEPSYLFNENLKGKKTSSKSPSKENTAKIQIDLNIKEGAFVSTEIIELQF